MGKLHEKSKSGELESYIKDSMLDLSEFVGGYVTYCSIVICDAIGECHVTLVGRKGEK